MRIIKPTSTAIISGILVTILMTIMKVLDIGIIIKLSWWLIISPLIMIMSGLLIYVAVYFGRIAYKHWKFSKNSKSGIQ